MCPALHVQVLLFIAVPSQLRSALDGLHEHAAEVAAELRHCGGASGLAQELNAAAARLAAQLPTGSPGLVGARLLEGVLICLPAAAEVGRLLLQAQERPQQQDAARLQAAWAAATRSCAYL